MFWPYKNVLGWRLDKEGEYIIKLPLLSEEEETVILRIEDNFRDVARVREFNTIEEVREGIKKIIEKVGEEERIIIEEEQREYLIDISLKHIYGLGAFEELLEDDDIEEIAVIGIGKPVYIFHRDNGWMKTNLYIESLDFLIDIINKMASTIGRRITIKNPRIDAMLKDGSRLHASIPPISEGELTIRKFRTSPLSPKEIVDFRTIDYKTMAILSLFMQSDSSIIISGNTASGKTTTLNSLFTFIPKNERILIIEETPEINIPHEHKVRLVSNKDRNIKLEDLVYDSLRMRPDRVIVGEIRNKEETRALVDVLLAGQARGAYATFHAKTAEECIARMKNFGVDEYELKSIDLIMVQRRMGLYEERKIKETRKLLEVALVNGDRINTIIKYSPKKRSWIYKEGNMLDSLSSKTTLSKREVVEEISLRTKFLREADAQFSMLFNKWQTEWLRT